MFFRRHARVTQPHVRASKKLDPFTDESSIGHILMKMGVLTKEQLVTAIGQKSYHDELLLGGLLKQLGMCTETQVARALMVQARLRSGEKALAELELLEARVEQYADAEKALQIKTCKLEAGERNLRGAIDDCRQDQRDHGEASGLWLVPLKTSM